MRRRPLCTDVNSNRDTAFDVTRPGTLPKRVGNFDLCGSDYARLAGMILYTRILEGFGLVATGLEAFAAKKRSRGKSGLAFHK